MRPSALLIVGEKKILIDIGPDFRQQALSCSLNGLDGVVLTHAHSDHVAGLDDLRVFYLMNQRKVPCLLSEETLRELQQRFYYLFKPQDSSSVRKGNLMAKIDFQVLEKSRGETKFSDVPVKYFTYSQGPMSVNGYRFGNLAYVTDICDYPESIFEDLNGVKTLVLSAPQYESSYVHFGVDEAIAFSRKLGVEKTYLMHISHKIDHEEGSLYLPSDVFLGYDGLELEFQIDEQG